MILRPIGLLVALTLSLTNLTTMAEDTPEQKALMEKIAYFIGVQTAKGMSNDGISVDPDQVAAGMKDAFAGGDLKYPEEELQAAMMTFQQQMQSKQQEQASIAGDKNTEAGTAFLAENGKRPEVTTTASGLQYEVMTEGTGAKPVATDTVNVHYHGTLIDGTVFDSSVERGEPISFPLNRVIPGWTEGLQNIPTGGKYKLFIPSELAYGAAGSPPVIGPNSTLVFEVELLGIE